MTIAWQGVAHNAVWEHSLAPRSSDQDAHDHRRLRATSHRALSPPPAHVEREFRRYLECGILGHGLARARCAECGHDYLIAYSCKDRGVCPSCPTGIPFGHNTRRMVETAAHLADHVMPRLPVRQWVLSVPKRLRCYLQSDPAVPTLALHIFLSAMERGTRRPNRRWTTNSISASLGRREGKTNRHRSSWDDSC